MEKLHIVFFPMLAHGHMIPFLDMAKLFVSIGVKATVVATPAFSDPIRKAQESGHEIGLKFISFPPQGSSLPANIVSFDQVSNDEIALFFMALEMMKAPFELLLEELKPACVVSDMFLPWTVDSAAKFGIPRLIFSGSSYIGSVCGKHLYDYKPFRDVSSDTEPFLVPNLPHELTFVRTQLPPFAFETENSGPLAKWRQQAMDCDKRSYGSLMNTFYELESAYAEHYKNVLGRRAWEIGPLLLCNKDGDKEKSIRGKASAIDEHECLRWLDSKPPNSVVYVCFGSMASFTKAQLHEMAKGLEDSGQNFIWVVRKWKNEQDEDMLPQGFEEKTGEKGLVIRGWAPQVLILNHPSVGAFVTHCGWNSTLEGVAAGLPFITWPVGAEQFYNEKLLVEVVKTGVSVGSKKWQRAMSEGVSAEAFSAAVRSVLLGDAAAEMRRRTKYYKKAAIAAVAEGGSSFNSLNDFISEIRQHQINSKTQ